MFWARYPYQLKGTNPVCLPLQLNENRRGGTHAGGERAQKGGGKFSPHCQADRSGKTLKTLDIIFRNRCPIKPSHVHYHHQVANINLFTSLSVPSSEQGEEEEEEEE